MSDCVPCSGRGWRWGRGKTTEAYMVKRPCKYCKATGKKPINKGSKDDQSA